MAHTERCARGRRPAVLPGTIAVVLAGLAGPLTAGEYVSYPQFRYTGGLPGNGWAVDAEGHAGFEGAMSQCIPLGYTPARQSFAVGYHVGSVNGGISLNLGGRDSNGMLEGSVGFGSAGHGMCLTVDAVDNEFDAVINLQGQVLAETDRRPAVSVGVLDLLNEREAIAGAPPGDNGARSFYVAATKRLEAADRPLHVTVGWGSDRFRDRPFAGVSYDVHRRVKVLAEYDGFGVNAAVAAQVLPTKRHAEGIYDEPTGREDALILFLGAADLEKPVVGIAYAR
jgi:hypothetical protein